MPWGIKIMLEFTGSSIIQRSHYLVLRVSSCACSFKQQSYVSFSFYFLDYLQVNLCVVQARVLWGICTQRFFFFRYREQISQINSHLLKSPSSASPTSKNINRYGFLPEDSVVFHSYVCPGTHAILLLIRVFNG